MRKFSFLKAVQLCVFIIKKNYSDSRQDYAEIDKSYESMKASKRLTEDSALVSLRYAARNMLETCDVLFENFPGLLSKQIYRKQVVDILQDPKRYIMKLEDDKDTEISVTHSTE